MPEGIPSPDVFAGQGINGLLLWGLICIILVILYASYRFVMWLLKDSQETKKQLMIVVKDNTEVIRDNTSSLDKLSSSMDDHKDIIDGLAEVIRKSR